jgi:PAS domain S-box-containing protein
MSIVGLDNRLLAVNQRLCQITGYSEVELLQKTLTEVTYAKDADIDLKSVQQLIKGKIPYFDIEKRYIKKDNSIIWVHLMVSAVNDEEGKPIYTLAMIEDIDVKKKIIMELVKTNNEKDKFFSIMAHDLKTPMATLAGISDIIVEDIDNMERNEIKQLAEMIQSSSRMTLNLLDDLLDWSRYNSGKIKYDPEHFELNKIILEVTRLYRLNISQKKIILNINTEKGIKVFADRNMIYTSLRNLLSNAIKFTSTGGEITITTERLALQYQNKIKVDETFSPDNKKTKYIVKISIKDNGVGIKKEKIDSLFLFDPMKSTIGTDNELGTGLGLVIVKEFIEKHKGNVYAESEPGAGSKFVIEFPCE